MGYKCWLASRILSGIALLVLFISIRLAYPEEHIGLVRIIGNLSVVVFWTTFLVVRIGPVTVRMYMAEDAEENDISGKRLKVPKFYGLARLFGMSTFALVPKNSFSGPGKEVVISYRPGERPMILSIS